MPDNFDMYDLYVEGESRYCYSGSGVLINKLGIRDMATFRKAEADIAFAGLLELALNPIRGNFDKEHLFAIHKFLFKEFYDFAGKIRKEDISKGNTKFCVWSYIDDQLDELFKKVAAMDKPITRDEVIDYLAYIMSELNIIHPFREGNGRSIREFIREYALDFGYKIDWARVDKQEHLEAMVASVLDTTRLKICLDECME